MLNTKAIGYIWKEKEKVRTWRNTKPTTKVLVMD